MPTLKQLTCSIELGTSKTKLKEYSPRYKDGYVETFIQAPDTDITFSLHLTSNGYIAPGLAAFVYMDGVYQCNRNRMGLQMPMKGLTAKDYEIDVRMHQKEEKTTAGTFVGHNANQAPKKNRKTYANIGSIEVVILRCKPDEIPARIKDKYDGAADGGNGNDLKEVSKRAVIFAPDVTMRLPLGGGDGAGDWDNETVHNHNFPGFGTTNKRGQPGFREVGGGTAYPGGRNGGAAPGPADGVAWGVVGQAGQNTPEHFAQAGLQNANQGRQRAARFAPTQNAYAYGYGAPNMQAEADQLAFQNATMYGGAMNQPMNAYAGMYGGWPNQPYDYRQGPGYHSDRNFANNYGRYPYRQQGNMIAQAVNAIDAQAGARAGPSPVKQDRPWTQPKIPGVIQPQNNDDADYWGDQQGGNKANGGGQAKHRGWGNGNGNAGNNGKVVSGWANMNAGNQAQNNNGWENNNGANNNWNDGNQKSSKNSWGVVDNGAQNNNAWDNNNAQWNDPAPANNGGAAAGCAGDNGGGVAGWSKDNKADNAGRDGGWGADNGGANDWNDNNQGNNANDGWNDAPNNNTWNDAPNNNAVTGWDNTSQKSSRTVSSRSQSDSKNFIKPYFADWNKPTAPTPAPRRQPRPVYNYPAVPLPSVPEEVVEGKNATYGVQTGQGAGFAKATRRPVYLDDMSCPYAVFSFKYRSKEALEKILNGQVDEMDMRKVQEAEDRERFLHMPKEALAQMLAKAKNGGQQAQQAKQEGNGGW